MFEGILREFWEIRLGLKGKYKRKGLFSIDSDLAWNTYLLMLIS